MIPSHEIRWFFPQKPFPREHLVGQAPSDQPRTDWYAWPCGDASGVKIREGRLETKLRHRASQNWQTELTDGTVVSGRIERWTKWSADLPGPVPPSDELLKSAGWIAVTKSRALQKFAVDGESVGPVSGNVDSGVQVEWTHLSTDDGEGWTIGLEAFGPVELQPQMLQQVLHHICRQTAFPPGFSLENSCGYPAWLNARGCH